MNFATATSVCVIACALATPATAQNAQDFYVGKQLTVTVASTAGGGQDSYGRLVGRHLGKFVRGQPTVVVVNMPGAAGRTAIKSLDVGRKEGLNIVAFSSMLVGTSIIEDDKSIANFNRFAWVGAVGQEPRVCFMRTATGVLTFDELMKRKAIVFGNVGTDMTVTYMKMAMGADIKLVLGYPGLAEKRLALERGELDGDCGTIAAIPPAWLAQKFITPFVRLHNIPMEGIAKDVPYLGELVRNDPEKRALLEFIELSTDIGRPFITAGDTPADRVALLRDGFAKMAADPAFAEDAKRQALDVTPISGEELQRTMDKVYGTSPAIVAKARELLRKQD